MRKALFERLGKAVEGPAYKWWAFAAVSIGVFMSTLDVSIVNISLPRIMTGLNAGFDAVQWVVLSYLLTITSLLLAFGSLADLIGRKKVYVAGFAVFTFGNLFAAIAPNVVLLIVARALAGVGGAMIQANGAAITAAVFPPEERGKALGLNGTIVASGLVAGPTIGGVLTDALGWRSVFYIAIPVGLTAIPFAALVLRERLISTGARLLERRFDWPGAALWAGFLFCLLFGLNRGSLLGWKSSAVVALFAASGLLLASFLVRELKVSNPTIRLSLFRVWGFSAGSTASFASFMGQQASVFLMPFYLQLALGLSARTAGVLMTAVPFSMAVVAPISGRLSDRYGSRGLATAGLAVVGAGLFLLSSITTESQDYGPILGAFVLLGLGMGLFQSPNNSFIFGAVPREFYGVASGFIATLRNAGSSLGIAVWGTIVTSQLASHGFKGDLQATVSNPGLAERVMPVFLDGMHLAMHAAVIVIIIGIIASALRGPAGDSRPPVYAAQAQREEAGRSS
ncbi:MAG: MFS transporter [Dehalococcoidia bacterium]|nr:MFS transporter [Dehalococcoidia bacterium]